MKAHQCFSPDSNLAIDTHVLPKQFFVLVFRLLDGLYSKKCTQKYSDSICCPTCLCQSACGRNYITRDAKSSIPNQCCAGPVLSPMCCKACLRHGFWHWVSTVRQVCLPSAVGVLTA